MTDPSARPIPAPLIAPLIARARSACARIGARLGAPGVFAAVAPGRVNLIGEHVDYNGGLVLPMAIDREAIVVARAAPAMRLHALDLGETAEPRPDDPLAAPPDRPWARYPLGVAREIERRGRRVPPLEIALTSTVPIGAGLSSSAAIEVATATLLELVTGLRLGPREKALLCQRAEHASSGVPCGIMDLLVATSAQTGHALLIDCRTDETTPVPMPSPDDATLLVIDTGVHRALATTAYAERRATCARAAAKLGVEHLCQATPGALAAAGLDPVEHRRARHVVGEQARTRQAADDLDRGDLEGVGAVMGASHDSLRDDYEVSCPELDTVVEAARAESRRTPGSVLGARMTGAGFGGCAIVLCRPAAAGTVSARVTAAFVAAHGRPPVVFPVCAAGAARPLAPGSGVAPRTGSC